MASVIGKRVNGRTYYYLAESGRVDGKPRIVAQRYLGTAEEIGAAVSGRESAAPARAEQLPFGAVAGVWNVIADLGLAELTDGVVGRTRMRVPVGTYLALAVLQRVVAPHQDLAGWWSGVGAERIVRPCPPADALSQSRLWRALDRLTAGHVEQLQAALRASLFEPGSELLLLDVPQFTTFTDAAGDRLWPIGLGLVVTLDGAIPLLARPYRHVDSAAPTFSELADELAEQLGAPVTVVLDTEQSALVNLKPRLDRHGAHPAPGATGPPHSFIGSLPPSDHPALLAVPASRRQSIDPGQPGLTAFDAHARVSGVERRAVLVHSANLQAAHARGLAQDLGQATRRLRELADALSRGELGQSRELLAAEVSRITRFRWGERVLSTSLSGSGGLRWRVDTAALSRLHSEHFGKQLLITSHDDWPVPQIVTAYRAKYRVESTLRQWVGPVVEAPSAAWRWNDQRVAIDTLISVLATTVTHVMRLRAQQAGLNLSVRDLLDQLAGIEETLLRYPSSGGRPRTRRVLTTMDPVQEQLFELFGLGAYAPPSS
ncbi:IS1634 family transposase [Flindersiella endophytica]